MKKYLIVTFFKLTFLIGIKAQCWKESYGRGAGIPLFTCPNGTEANGALCYKQCRSGYAGNGPVCWEICKIGFTDYGLLCYRSEFVYSKKCNKINNVQSCSPCLTDYKDLGLHCKLDSNVYIKKSYSRGIGEPMACSAEYEQDAGLCYEKCQPGDVGIGPVCWTTCNNTEYSFDCGVVCAQSDRQCALFVTGTGAAGLGFFGGWFFVPVEVSSSVYQSAINGAIVSGLSGSFGVASSLLIESCDAIN